MKKFIIYNESVGKRLDKFLKEELFLDILSRGLIIENIKEKKVYVNGKVSKPSYVLKENDEIEVIEPETWIVEREELKPNNEIELEFIYQDENIIILNKPAGLVVHPSENRLSVQNNTVVNALLAQFPEIGEVGDEPNLRPGIVHRLDKDTTGVMVVARNQKTFLELKNKFKNREVEKAYLALVYGHLEPKEGIVDKPLVKTVTYKKQKVARGKEKDLARKAVTHYHVVDNLGDFDLIEATPKTGRTHQIRIHLASLGHPIVGDETYKFRNLPAIEGVKRQMLHAKSLKFNLFGKDFSFEVPVSQDMSTFMHSLTLTPKGSLVK